jgi:hypothetical protein
LFDLVEGVNDLRWLLWLEQQAEKGGEAADLLSQLKGEVPGRWADLIGLGEQQLATWRSRIVDLVAKQPAKGME